MTENHSLSMYKYNTWANNTLLKHLKQLPEGICDTNIKSVFPSIIDTLIHIYIIDRGWYSILTKEYRSDDYETIKASVDRLVAETKDISLKDLEKKQQLLAADVQSFIESHDMNYRDTFSGVSMTYGEVFIHIVNHGTYHRGNITAMLYQLDQKGVPTDYGVYLYYATQA
ncbi:DinB family protein [Pedobacter heparinus]|uniref:DinB family protein n=1 Tax=Pedobacter heparinus (strain ATCC 13125 / DSM 2366 / CIP 104194 / JCM 7457 / NBRC 12017 / NCIMB 9290 / NRRL B-14731 / HIM 762-3) TaxID=485917 RepID=C6XVB2_PEDHD|nr:DinB family protein [Pedobacter heparinus]ACU03978.1 DinB family protein [Pedobacter heparinus DSM 2366]